MSTRSNLLSLTEIKSFLKLRRYETITIHTLLQNFRIEDCDWLRPASSSKKSNFNQKPNEVEMIKRRELLSEFLFWFIDGFLMNVVKVS